MPDENKDRVCPICDHPMSEHTGYGLGWCVHGRGTPIECKCGGEVKRRTLPVIAP